MITKFIENVKSDNSPVIFGDGSQKRDFVYIEDITNAISLTIKSDNAIGHVLNIGTDRQTSIKNLEEIITKIYNKKLYPKFEEIRLGDIKDSYADITKARKMLGYEPKYSLEEGLRLCINDKQ